MRVLFLSRARVLPSLALALALALALGACTRFRPGLHAAPVDTVLKPNQKIEWNSLWAKAKPVTVHCRQPGAEGGETWDVVLRAVHDGRAISILAMWIDATESQERVQWVMDPRAKKYYLMQSPTDFLAFKFCISGAQDACMMTGREGVYDVWEWRAGWSHISGHADDRTMTITLTPPEKGEARSYPAGESGGQVFIVWKDDDGRLPYEKTPRPSRQERDVMPGIRPVEPTGSAGDVLAEQVYENSTWMVEFYRLLETKNDDDYQFKGKGPHPFSIAVSDDQEGQAHYTSGLVNLFLD